jgi:hypothetical protein
MSQNEPGKFRYVSRLFHACRALCPEKRLSTSISRDQEMIKAQVLAKEGEPTTPKGDDGTELWSKEAYHINCIDCHKGEITKVPKDAGKVLKQGEGPTKCAACHEVKE